MNKRNKLTNWQKLSNVLSRIVRRRYYLVTYQGVRRDNDPSIDVWHDVTDKSPMEYRQVLIEGEENTERKSYYMDFIILNTERITRSQYNKWKGCF